MSPITGGVTYCDITSNGLTATPLPTPPHTPDSKLSSTSAPKRMYLQLLYAAYTPSPSVRQQCRRADTPSQLLFYISLESHTVEQNCYDIQRRLDPVWPGQSKNSVIGVKEFHQTLDHLPKAVRSCFLPGHQHESVMNRRIKYHVKYDGG